MSQIWEKSLSLIKEKLTDHNFDTWIKPLKLISMDNDKIEIEVPNKFFQDWLNDNYNGLICESLREVGNREYNVYFKVKKETGRYVRNQIKSVDKTEQVKETSQETPKELKSFYSQYTFENFVEGASNKFAKAAAMAVCDNPGRTYNPLFIHGGVGLGKTHLLHAIGNCIKVKNRKASILYVSAEKFLNEFVSAIRFNKTPEIRSKYVEVDALLIDDIQFIAGKQATQEEFFHTFNSLFESHKQIVMTSDSFPKDIEKLDERLRSRFEWGLIADIQPPELELRAAILNDKAAHYKIQLPDDVALLIATNVKSNIRELEGALTRVVAFSSLTGRDITVSNTKEVLKISEDTKILSIPEIQKVVASYYNIKVSDLKSQRKIKTIAGPRQVAMYLSRCLTNTSYPQIGNEFGNKDHSTVMYAVKKIEREITTDSSIKSAVDTLSKTLKD